MRDRGDEYLLALFVSMVLFSCVEHSPHPRITLSLAVVFLLYALIGPAKVFVGLAGIIWRACRKGGSR